MSSNITVSKICEQCGKEFIAKKTTTKCCSDSCAKKAYKARIRQQKINQVNIKTQQIKAYPTNELKALSEKPFLSITEACKLLSISRWTIWRAIKDNGFNAAKVGRRVLIRRYDIDNLFKP